MIAEPTQASKSVQKENSIGDVTSCGSVSHSSGGGRNENRQKPVRGKRKTREGSENVKRKHSRSSNGSLGRAENKHLKNGDTEAVTLFEVVTMGRAAMQAVVDDWIDAYVADRDGALLDLISFFIQCSGCKGLVTAEMFQSRQDTDVMSKMVEDVDEGTGLQYKKFLAFPWILTVTWPMDADGGEYPLTTCGAYWKRFRSQFCEFVSVLVTQCQYSIVFDSYLMSTLISLLTELSDSRVRAFRHTCTLAGMKLISALVNVGLNLSVSVDNSQRLHEVEQAKTPTKRAVPRLERIRRKISELQDRKLEIENMMDAIFKGIFLKRYRDAVPEIRAICLEELAVWMRLYSSVFLNDSNLKYVGWMLYDKQSDVRLKCVLGLQTLYEDTQLSPKMDLFTVRFKERIVSMTLDKDHEVAVQAMRLVMVISQSCDEVLSQKDYSQLFQCVFASHRPLSATAGEFLCSRLLTAPDPVSSDGATEEQRNRAITLKRVRTLLQFYQESGLHQHVLYLVDSLWDCAGALLRDWASLTSLLLLHPSSPSPSSSQEEGVVLTGAEEGFLIEILLASVRQAAEGPPLARRGTGKRGPVVSCKEKKSQVDECPGWSDHLLKVLPELLIKFSEDKEKMTSLLKIPQYFHMDACSERPTRPLQALLAQMEAAVNRHSDAELLEAAARSYQSLCSEGSAWPSLASSNMDQLVQRWVRHLGTLLEEALKDDNFTASDHQTGEIQLTLQKITIFQNTQDLSKMGLYELGTRLLVVETQRGGVPVEVTVEALRCVCYSTLWKLNTFGEVSSSRETALHRRNQLRSCCEKCHRCLTHPEQQVREQAFMSLCDVLIAHNYQLLTWDPSAGAPLLYTLDPKLQKALLTFTVDHVFSGADTDSYGTRAGESEVGASRQEDLHRRRNLLAAYCKLIVHSVLEMSMAAEIFKHYVKYFNDFGDIIKETLNRTRQMDKIESARTLVLCLQQLFLRLKQEQDSGNTCSSGVQTYSSIKELARRLSLTFGWDQVKSRESLAMIHRDGIDFVFQGFSQQAERHCPPYVSYLTILSEFSIKLLKPDKKTVYGYLQKYTGEHAINNREECWLPLIYYRASLQATGEGEDAVSFISSDASPSNPSRSSSARQLQTVLNEAKTPPPPTWIDTKGTKIMRSTSCPDEQRPVAREPAALESASEMRANNDEVDVDTV
ncbi:cohesin subunit SA-2 isoform X1 [Denticeps clupeoides]|uniref:Cohesin subunit SA n=1 Tax=Denticeps clupeoides TaxID=299321 RepID=A0AAY4ECC6_9TELE|nr:cohesin subunit SA-2-like isoform X1 [Denticeps clupeoides]XP_028846270.1 cohesin subunit SA-2-like isoform X1 [Denticeps clupeoides]XP_028846271.1 cohesin subunit SA-2-like isoform X1 [Denticeps clupeoides]